MNADILLALITFIFICTFMFSQRRRFILLLPFYFSLILAIFTQREHTFALRGILVVCGVFIVIFIFPIPSFAALTGKHTCIGCFITRLNGVQCRVFYPASVTQSRSGERADYLHFGHDTLKGISIKANKPWQLFNNMKSAQLRALSQAPIATPLDKYGFPLVIFSHGLGGTCEIYSALAEEWTSHGFVVVCLNHSDGSALVYHDDNSLPVFYTHPPHNEPLKWRTMQLNNRVIEMNKVIDALHSINNSNDINNNDVSHMLNHRLNLNKLAVAGHSFGGATAFESAFRDRIRIHSVLVYDIWCEPMHKNIVDEGIAVQPVLSVLSSSFWHTWSSFYTTFDQRCTHNSSHLWHARHFNHINFSDMPLFSPLLYRLLGVAGKISPTRALAMSSQLGAEFLTATLDKQQPNLYNVGKKFAELNCLTPSLAK